jgi:hypothetical protein
MGLAQQEGKNKPVGMPVVGGLTVITLPSSHEADQHGKPVEMGSQPFLP